MKTGALGLAVVALLLLGACESGEGAPVSTSPPTSVATSTPALTTTTAGEVGTSVPTSTIPPRANKSPTAVLATDPSRIEVCDTYPGGHFYAGPLEFDPDELVTYGADHADVWGGAVLRHLVWVDAPEPVTEPLIAAFVTDSAAVHDARLRELFEGKAIVGVELVERTLADLQDGVARLEAALIDVAGLIRVTPHILENRVMVEVETDTDMVRDEIVRAVSSDVVCLAPHTGPVTPWGEQPQFGDGWRLLGETLHTRPYWVSAATTRAGFETMWQRWFTGEPPQVRFPSEVVLMFGAATSSCPEIRFERVIIETDPATVRAAIAHPGLQGPCRMVANGHGYAVAVDRSLLPDRFTLELGAGIPDEPRIEVDLTDPGGDATRWGPVVNFTVAHPSGLEQSVGLMLRFVDEAGTVAYEGTEAIEVTPDGTVFNTAAAARGRTLPGPGDYTLEFGITRRTEGGDLVTLGTCQAGLTLEAFTVTAIRVEITRIEAAPSHEASCRITAPDE